MGPAILPLEGAPDLDLHVGGAWRVAEGAARIAVASPATRAPIASVPDAGPQDVDAACRAAAEAAPGWAAMTPAARARLLRAFGDLLAARMGPLAELESAVTGRPIREMRAQMARIPEWLDHLAALGQGLEGESHQLGGGLLGYTAWEPFGVCALLTPWNHPVLILVKKLAAALAAGNTAVVKPSELAPVSPLILSAWAIEAGIPPGVVNVVTGGSAAGAALVAHPAVARVDLTGGTETGRRVAASAGERLVPCTLELGGKTPVVIFADAPLEEAVAGALFAGFVAAGQTCVSGARILVERAAYPAFVARFAERTADLKLGDPADPATQVGPVISAAARDRCLDHIRAARAEGARLVAGGEAPALPAPLAQGFFVAPTVFADVTSAMRLFREEVFGPVVSITPFDGEEEAVALANAGPYALGASLWTRDAPRAHRVAARIEAGVLWINDHHKNDPRSVWGGWGASGYGKENGWDALTSYLRKRSVVVRTAERFDDWFAGGARYG
jgi:acyl-CoA reductase-like NAD-dependent aldehyde dehydrogenase